MLLLSKGLCFGDSRLQAGLNKKERLEETADEQAGFPCFPAYLQCLGPECVLGLMWDAVVGIIHVYDVCHVNSTRIKLLVGIQLRASLGNF